MPPVWKPEDQSISKLLPVNLGEGICLFSRRAAVISSRCPSRLTNTAEALAALRRGGSVKNAAPLPPLAAAQRAPFGFWEPLKTKILPHCVMVAVGGEATALLLGVADEGT